MSSGDFCGNDHEDVFIIIFQLTSVAMTHSLLSSAITNTDWYMESLEEHIVDILHSGFSLQTQITLCVNTNWKHMAQLCIRRTHVQ